MKKLGLIVALFLLFSAVSNGAVPNDKEFKLEAQAPITAKTIRRLAKQLQEYVTKTLTQPRPT